MALTSEEERGQPCPKCKEISIKLIALNDDGTGRRWCQSCKRKWRKIK